jgi:hypothetical protein
MHTTQNLACNSVWISFFLSCMTCNSVWISFCLSCMTCNSVWISFCLSCMTCNSVWISFCLSCMTCNSVWVSFCLSCMTCNSVWISCCPVQALWLVFLLPNIFRLFGFKYFGFERSWWTLFQKCVVRTRYFRFFFYLNFWNLITKYNIGKPYTQCFVIAKTSLSFDLFRRNKTWNS